MLHAGDEGRDHCKKDLRNPQTWVMYFLQCRCLQIPPESMKKAFYCIHNAKRTVIRNNKVIIFMIHKRRQSQKELQEKERKTNQKTDTQQYSHVRLSNQQLLPFLHFRFSRL